MTQDEIIEMADKADEEADNMLNMKGEYHPNWHQVRDEAFAKLVAERERERLTDAAMKAAEKAVDLAIALEREACAKLVEESSLPDTYSQECLPEIANDIRARGGNVNTM
jgi:hypothetical protein